MAVARYLSSRGYQCAQQLLRADPFKRHARYTVLFEAGAAQDARVSKSSAMEPTDELKDVRALFEEAERLTDPVRKYDVLYDALVMLEEYEQDHPRMEESERVFLKNLRHAHTRRLLRQLLSMPNPDVLTWLKYYLLFIDQLKVESASVLREHPELQGRFDEFKELYWKQKRKKP